MDINLLVTHPFLMLWAGQVLHILKKVKELEERNPRITIRRYVRRHVYGVLFSLVGGLVAYAMLFEMNELSAVSAFMAGYMSDSLIDAAASRVKRKVSGDNYYQDEYDDYPSEPRDGVRPLRDEEL